jgi:hypothetical protein
MREMLAVMLEGKLTPKAKRIISLVKDYECLRNDIYSPDSTEEQVVLAIDELISLISDLNLF